MSVKRKESAQKVDAKVKLPLQVKKIKYCITGSSDSSI